MFIKDGSEIDYANDDNGWKYIANDLACGKTEEEIFEDGMNDSSPRFENLYMFGWIGNEVERIFGFNEPDLKSKIIEKLKSISDDYKIDQFKGWHTCEVCCAEGKTYKDEGVGSFGGSIKISHNFKIYCCPFGVEHYIEKHGYRPSDEVIDAILNGKYLSRRDIIAKTFEIHGKEIEKERKKFAKQLKEEKEEQEKQAIKREIEEKKRWDALTPSQQSILTRVRNGTMDFISIGGYDV